MKLTVSLQEAVRWIWQKVNEPGDKISVPRAWVQKPLQGTLHQSGAQMPPESSSPGTYHFLRAFVFQALVLASVTVVFVPTGRSTVCSKCEAGESRVCACLKIGNPVRPPCNFGFRRARSATFSREAGNHIFL